MLRPVPNAPLLLPDASRRLALPDASLLQRARARARLGRTYLAADGASCPRRCSCAPNTPRASARAPLCAALVLANEAAARRSSCWHAWARRGRAHACGARARAPIRTCSAPGPLCPCAPQPTVHPAASTHSVLRGLRSWIEFARAVTTASRPGSWTSRELRTAAWRRCRRFLGTRPRTSW